ncbi:hypothetical protein H5410_000254 [Solanum commersonii]|uniref:Uncharacterized protein n=1 Tax=Solanum commersonii TaxID=4109 RepID=A0A9J6AW05_SOLCO|nr:hypothetical protein H5410_000254 [Solanum commersonii]
MFDTTSIDACCPIFRKILGTSCPCYKYAEDLDNQILITLEAYCDVSTPCKGVQVINLSKDDGGCNYVLQPPPSGRGKRSRCGRGRGREWEQVKIMAMVNSMLFIMAISLSTTISMPSSKTTTKSTISTTTSTTKPSPSSSRPGNNLFAR